MMEVNDKDLEEDLQFDLFELISQKNVGLRKLNVLDLTSLIDVNYYSILNEKL